MRVVIQKDRRYKTHTTTKKAEPLPQNSKCRPMTANRPYYSTLPFHIKIAIYLKTNRLRDDLGRKWPQIMPAMAGENPKKIRLQIYKF